MRGTQRSESMNNQIKSFLRSCKRTSFVRLIEIFDEINKEESEKVRIRSKSFEIRVIIYSSLLQCN